MKLLWLTDIHLDLVEKVKRFYLYQEIANHNIDGILITGDIAEAPTTAFYLREILSIVAKPIYFVLGNHDYYSGNVASVKNNMMRLSRDEALLHCLSITGPQMIRKDIALLGQDGWADGRYGDYKNTQVVRKDWEMIHDLFQAHSLGKDQLLKKMQELADKDAMQLLENLNVAIHIHKAKTIIIQTHIPPYKDACFHKGDDVSEELLPFYSCKAMGDVLSRIARQHQQHEFIVLCGHTHHKAHYQPYENLTIKVGQAEYLSPEIQEIICL